MGHGAILHGCTIGDETLIGMGAILLNGAVIGRHCIFGAGALVYRSPARVKGQLDEAAITDIRRNAVDYRREAADWFPEYGDK